VAIAVAPRYPDNARSHDTIEQLVLADQLQTASVRFAQQLPDTLTARLADTGILVLCHVNPKTTRARRRAIVRERAEAASLFLRREFGCGACIGAGRLVERPQSLHRSAEQALVAMQIAVHRGIELVFHEDQLAPEREQTLMPVPRATARLLTEYERGTAERLDAAFSELVRTALDQAAGRPSVARAHFEHALSALLERVQRRAQLDARAYAELEQRVAEALGRAQTGTELILAVRDCFDALQRATERPEDEQRELRLGRAAGYIKDHCHQPIDLAEAARQAGLSRTYFSRAFKSAFGVGFGRYLQDRRLERARELLQATTIAIGRVSQESGFVSVTHFAVAFKRAHGVTPLEYRRRMQERAAQRD
jgi:AraC-like DNA-binding protein